MAYKMLACFRISQEWLEYLTKETSKYNRRKYMIDFNYTLKLSYTFGKCLVEV